MKEVLFQNKLIVKKSKIHGYGVFAGKDMKPNEIIEECYPLYVTTLDPALEHYHYDLYDRLVLPTGYSMLYNHSNTPNIDVDLDRTNNLVIVYALTAIKKGDELMHHYGQWFEDELAARSP